MGTITATNRINTALDMLDDPSGRRWDAATFMLQAVNDGQRDIVSLRPDANPVPATLDLVPGCFQTVPASYYTLINLVCNLGTDGLTPGRALTRWTRAELDAVNPYWPADDPAAEARLWVYEREADPRQYLVWPPQPATGCGKLRGIFSQLPADVALGDPLIIGDEFAEPLLLFIMARAKARDKENTVDMTMAEKMRRAYFDLLGVQDEARRKGEAAA